MDLFCYFSIANYSRGFQTMFACHANSEFSVFMKKARGFVSCKNLHDEHVLKFLLNLFNAITIKSLEKLKHHMKSTFMDKRTC